MTYKLTIEQKPAYLHAIVSGPNTRENLARYGQELLQECIARGCNRLLVEERLEGPRLGTLDVFEAASAASINARGKLKTIAFVDVYAEGNLMKFAENVARNRALRLTVFPTVADAEKWLLAEDCVGGESRTVTDGGEPPG